MKDVTPKHPETGITQETGSYDTGSQAYAIFSGNGALTPIITLNNVIMKDGQPVLDRTDSARDIDRYIREAKRKIKLERQ